MIKIGRITVSLEMREVYADGELLPLGSRAFGILELLIEAKGKTVTKDEIFQHVWPNSIVEENNIHVQLSALRKVFGGDKQAIRTISGRGYRLAMAIESIEPDGLPAVGTPAAGTLAARTPAAGTAAATSTGHACVGRPNGLPNCHAPLIGREDMIAEVALALDNTSLVTLLGPGGIGKTQLGIAVAKKSIADASETEVCFINLEAVASGQSIVGTVAEALGLAQVEGEFALKALVAAIQGRKLLILLDNCEHVIDSAANVCDVLLQASADLRILATSRESLRTPGERSYWVSALDTPTVGASLQAILACSSAKLFLSQLNALSVEVTCDRSSLDMIATICRRLDGVPLAIELAAARAAVFGIRKLVSELDDRFLFLTGGRRTAPRRQQTLEASIDWSYELLTGQERTVLHLLGVFPTRFSLEEVCAVAASRGLSRNEVTEAIVGLASKCFVATTCGSKTKEYFLLETTREYALRKLDESAEVMAIKTDSAAPSFALHERRFGSGRSGGQMNAEAIAA